MTIKDLNYWKQRVNKITSLFSLVTDIDDYKIEIIRKFDESLLDVADPDDPLEIVASVIFESFLDELDELVEQVDGTEDSSIIKALIQCLRSDIESWGVAQGITAVLLKFPPLDYAKVLVYELVTLIDKETCSLGNILVDICSDDKLTEAVNQCWDLLPKHDLEKISQFIHKQESIPHGYLEYFPGVLKIKM